jgi:SAM-dependent MidA family methyltransferase
VSSALQQRITAVIDRHGPIGFDRYMELALYDPADGFYCRGGTAGRRGDFLTSPEVGPLFGAVVARALDASWDELGRPDAFVVVECGAGPGTLARSVLSAQPRCALALRYVLVDRAGTQRQRHSEYLSLEYPAVAFAPFDDDDAEPDGTTRMATAGPIVVSLSELPAIAVTGVVLANELLDNLVFAVLERTGGNGAANGAGWNEVLIGHDDGHLVEVLVPAPPGYADMASALAPHAQPGQRIPVQVGVWSWLSDALGIIERGTLLCIDYARATADMAANGGWLRTHQHHTAGVDALVSPGDIDITTDVALDQLERVARPTSVETQAAFLRRHGIDELVAEGRAMWESRAGVGDLAALAARSRVREAEALLDPTGLGGFTVMQWRV